MGSILVGFLDVLLYCAIVIFIAVCIVWAWTYFVGPIDAQVYKWGRIVIGLLCLIAIVGWLLSLLGLAGAPALHFPVFNHIR